MWHNMSLVLTVNLLESTCIADIVFLLLLPPLIVSIYDDLLHYGSFSLRLLLRRNDTTMQSTVVTYFLSAYIAHRPFIRATGVRQIQKGKGHSALPDGHARLRSAKHWWREGKSRRSRSVNGIFRGLLDLFDKHKYITRLFPFLPKCHGHVIQPCTDSSSVQELSRTFQESQKLFPHKAHCNGTPGLRRAIKHFRVTLIIALWC